MRRRKLTDEERQGALFDNASRSSWPVVHPEVRPKIEPLLQPVSDETGGPLSAAEAERVTRGASIRFAGHVFQDGLVHCRACSKWDSAEPLHPPGHGFRRSIYSGNPRDASLGRCGQCGVDVVGECLGHVASTATR